MIAYEATTRTLTVRVRPVYLDGKSSAMKHRFVFEYHVVIENDGPEEVQLVRRRWTIREEEGRVQDVEGDGVVGNQPIIEPGDAYAYSSFCILSSFAATMEGSYLMQLENGERFRISIPQFHLLAAAN